MLVASILKTLVSDAGIFKALGFRTSIYKGVIFVAGTFKAHLRLQHPPAKATLELPAKSC